ncbi:MAG: hypothetical protein EBU88_10005 [Acidobacteria bacterium]|nr:hypothetical protein [Acidobacteriota bacterium]
MIKQITIAILILVATSIGAYAQEFEIKNYDLTVRLLPEEQQIEVTAALNLVNLSGPDLADRILLSTTNRPRYSFFLNLKSQVRAMKVNGVAVEFKTTEDPRNNLLRVSTDISATIATARELTTELAYTLPTTERSSALHLSRSEAFVLPASFWFPVIHTPFAEHGADTAPVKITIASSEGLKVVSSGIRKSDNSFEQTQAALPFFIVGDFEVLRGGGDAYPVEVYYPRGVSDAGKQQAQRLVAEGERILKFYAGYFGVAVVAPFRIITTQARQLSTTTSDSFSQGREISFTTVGAVTVDDNLFRRDALDQGTIELLANAAARSWIDGQILLRGRGTGMLRDGLPAFLVAQYLGERFGQALQVEAWESFRRAYATIARSDAPLLMQSQLDRNYTTSIFNKGAMVWRLLESAAGQSIFRTAVRNSLSRNRVDVLILGDWRSPLCNISRCASLRNNLAAAGADRRLTNEVFTNWIETVVLPDFAIGQPQQVAAGWESTVTNFGTGDMTIEVVATTDKGEKLRQQVLVKASEYGTVTFVTNSPLVSIETDPENKFLQIDYANDIYPRRPSESEYFGQANFAFSRGDMVTAEVKAREGLKANPRATTLKALAGRILLAQKKTEEAAGLFEAALKAEPLPILAYGWSHQGLGEIALQQNSGPEAAIHFRLAAAADLDASSTIAARDGALKAEQAGGAIKIPEDIASFLQKFDAAVLQSTSAVVNPFVEIGNLRRFAQSLVVRKPSTWVTEPLRTEPWDGNRTAVDVSLRIRIEGRDYAGRAVYVISRAGGRVLLSEVPVFDVR